MSNRHVNVQKFAAAGSFTWTKVQGAKWVKVQMLSGGSGGDKDTPASNRGGNGGNGGGYLEIELSADILNNTETVVVGAGGLGATVNGNTGAVGGSSHFGNYIFARGANNTSFFSDPGFGFPINVTVAAANQNQRSGGSKGQVGNAGGIGYIGAAGGGGANSGALTAAFKGGDTFPAAGTAASGAGFSGQFVGAAGGAPGGTGLGAPGGDGVAPFPGLCFGGSGGGAGSSAAAANGGKGGNGIMGSGGGGGGGAPVGFLTGNGGNGGDGFIIVTTFV